MPLRPLVRLALGALLALAALPSAALDLPARLTLGIAIPTLPVFEVSAATSVPVNPLTPGPHLVSLAIASGLFGTEAVVIPVTDPSVAPVRGVQFTAANAAGSFEQSASGGFGGPMPIRGVAKICLFGACDAAVANIEVPLDVIGEGGAATAAGAVDVTVVGAPWTTNTRVVGAVTTRGDRHGPGGFASATAQLGGLLNLVTPIFVSTNLGAIRTIDVTGRIGVLFEGISTCDLEIGQPVYREGETVRLTRLRVSSERARRDYRMRIGLFVDVGGGFEIPLLDRVVTLGLGFERDLAPVDLVTVGPEQPRASYRLHCSLTDVATGEQHGDEVAFAIE